MSFGYDLSRFVDMSDADEQDLSCGICHEMLSLPVVTQCCQQMFCKLCIEEWLKNSKTCPFDRKDLTISGLSQPPRMVVNKLGQLKIKCDYEKRGCNEVVLLQDLTKHLKECHFRDICEKCSNKSQQLFEELIKSNEMLRTQIKELKSENDNSLKTIQKLTNDLDAIDPIIGPSDKRVFKAWKQITFGLEINELQIILNSRKYLAENEPIVIESNMSDDLRSTIVGFMKNQILNDGTNSVFDICKNVVQMLDMDYGNSWQCVADYDNSSMAYFTYESGFLIKLRFELLTFKIFKAFKFEEQNFIERFRRADKSKRQIQIKRSENMSEDMISFVKRITFAAIGRFDTLNEILVYIRDHLGREYGGLWYCLSYTSGGFPIKRIEGFFIDFELFEYNFKIFRTKD